MKHTFLSIIALLFVFSAYAQNNRQIELNKTNEIQFNSTESINSSPKTIYLNENFKNFNLWTVIDGGETTDTWQQVESHLGQTLDGTPFAYVSSDDAGQNDMDEILELTDGIDVTGATTLFISFDHFMWDWDTNPTPTQGDVDIWNGTEWITIYTAYNQDIGSWDTPDHQEIEITEYINDELKVRFHYTANWDFWWAVDNCFIYSRDDHDLVMQNKFLTWMFQDEPKIPSAEIFNFGLESENNYDVNYLIYNDNDEVVYDETINITQPIASNGTATVYFPSWTGTIAGNYNDTIIVTVADDGNTFNNKIGGEIKVIGEVEYDAGTIYGWNGDPTAYTAKISLETGELNNMQQITAWYWTCATYIDGRVYGINFNNNMDINAKLYYLNNDGIPYEIGDIDGTYNVSSMAHNPITGKTYITNFNHSGIYELLELDIENLTTTYIGTWGWTGEPGVGSIYGLACDNNGILYGLAGIINGTTYIVDDAKLVIVDKSTAEITEVGEIDVDIVYANHDLSFDRQTNTLYGSFLEGTDGAGIYTLNTENGEATLLHDLNLEYPISACAIVPSNPVNITDLNSDISIYPNPNNGIFTIENTGGFEKIEITDLTGKTIYSNQYSLNTNHLEIDLSEQNAGIYIINLSNNEKSYNYKVVLK